MILQESVLPRALLTYIEGLKTRDVDLIGSTFADDIRFVTPAKTMRREEILEFLAALYRGFPDWSYDHDEPVVSREGIYGVKWRQGGTHTGVLTFSGFKDVLATGKRVTIPEQFFYYQVRNKKLSEIRPDPVPGGAPRGIFEQIGVELPPL